MMPFTLHRALKPGLTDGVHSAELCIDFSDYPNGNTVHINKLHKQRFENQWVGKNAVCWIGHDVRVKSYL